MIEEKIINSASTKRVCHDCSASEIVAEITKFLQDFEKSGELKIVEKKIQMGESAKCEFEISEKDNGRKSFEIEIEW